MKIVIRSVKTAKDHGSNQGARCFQNKYPTIWKSTVRNFFKSAQLRSEDRGKIK